MSDGAVEQTPDSINEFTIVGDFGFQRMEGPFGVEKENTVWTITVPEGTHPTIQHMDGQTGEAVVLVADCTTVGGGIVERVEHREQSCEYLVFVDQYARGDL